MWPVKCSIPGWLKEERLLPIVVSRPLCSRNLHWNWRTKDMLSCLLLIYLTCFFLVMVDGYFLLRRHLFNQYYGTLRLHRWDVVEEGPVWWERTTDKPRVTDNSLSSTSSSSLWIQVYGSKRNSNSRCGKARALNTGHLTHRTKAAPTLFGILSSLFISYCCRDYVLV